jgi:hypothetical protein
MHLQQIADINFKLLFIIPMPSTSTINMLEDNILIEINGVGSMWDTYYLGLNVVTPGFKVSIK